MIKRVDVKWQREKVVLRVRHSRGVSLIIAIFFVSAFLLVMGGLFEASSRAIESVRNREIEAKLYYLAESASEMASYRAAKDGVGTNISRDDTGAAATAYSSFLAPLVTLANNIGISCTDIDPIATGNQPCVSFEVRGRAASTEQVSLGTQTYYSVPTKGTGDAAGSAGCGANSFDADDPCNWNKLYLGDSVEIPLFTETLSTSGGGSTFTANRANFSAPGSFKLRIRAPKCDVIAGVTGGWCDSTDPTTGRLVLYPRETSATNAPYRNIDTDPVLMQWQIADLEGGASLVARDVNISGVRPDPNLSANPMVGDNTELTGGRINAASNSSGVLQNFVVLGNTDNGINSENDPVTIDQFIRLDAENGTPVPTKPVLRLNLVGQPRIGTSGPSGVLSNENLNNRDLDIPYLEYQLLARLQVIATSPNISDSKSLVSGSAETPGFRTEFEQYRQRSSTVGGFALESF